MNINVTNLDIGTKKVTVSIEKEQKEEYSSALGYLVILILFTVFIISIVTIPKY